MCVPVRFNDRCQKLSYRLNGSFLILLSPEGIAGSQKGYFGLFIVKIFSYTVRGQYFFFVQTEFLLLFFKFVGRLLLKISFSFGKFFQPQFRIKYLQWLNETAPILAITTKESEEPVLIQVGVRGHLIEVNKRLVDNPQLLLESSEGAGYLAIVLPKANELENPLTSEHRLDQDRIEADLLTDEDAGSC